MSRVKIENAKTMKLKTWDDAEQHLKKISELTRKINSIENKAKEKISKITLDSTEKTKPDRDEIERISMELKEFTTEKKLELDGKSKNLAFGKVGFRKSTQIVMDSVKDVIKALKAKKMHDYINVKVEEKIDLKKLKECKDDVIESLGAIKKVEDVFYYETK